MQSEVDQMQHKRDGEFYGLVGSDYQSHGWYAGPTAGILTP